jgi:hypothetical protein
MAGLFAGVVAVLLLASAVRAADAPDVSAAEPRFIGGRYAVQGTITVKDTGEKRAIGGTLILDQRGPEFRTTYQLRTRVRTEEGVVRADVIGRGDGRVDGDRIEGIAESQLITASIGGAHGATPYLPRRIGPILRQHARGSIDEHGVIKLELDYTPVEGGPTETSHVVLYGERVDVE